MNLKSLSSLTAFLCMTGSFIAAGSKHRPSGDLHHPNPDGRTVHATDSFWSGVPTDELEAKIHFYYTQPTAGNLNNFQ